MPTCIPATNNNVTDVNANKPAPPGTNDSKLHKIMACLFFKKKTNVVDMKKDTGKKQRLTVDRSERSRRVLRMESTKEVPTERDESDADNQPQTSPSKQMFLPSENPTASFLSYLNPSVRRACSDVIKSSTDTVKPKSKEAFVQEGRPAVRTRNTKYRSQRDNDRKLIGMAVADKPPKLPARSQSQSQPPKKPIVVPGTMVGSDDDVGYNSDNNIEDLHEEIRRMNHSHSDVRRVNGSHHGRQRRREGSISLSEDESSSDDERMGKVIQNRPQNPGPEEVPEKFNPLRQSPDIDTSKDETNSNGNKSGGKKKSMEQVIDALFEQTQNNLDSIYQNGLEQLDEIDSYRPETATPETCMRRLEEQLREPSVVETNPNATRAFVNRQLPSDTNNFNTSGNSKNKKSNANEILEEYVPEMDGLLSDVSHWAKDRQTWLLNDRQQEDIRREDTSATFNDSVIDRVTRSNDDKCNEWVDDQTKVNRDVPLNSDGKMNGILTGPKLFRSASKTPYSRRPSISSGESGNANQTSEQKRNEENFSPFGQHMKTSNNSVNKNGLLIGNAPNVVSLSSLPGFGRQREAQANDEDNFSLMYCDDRSEIDNDLSDTDQQPHYRPRSPDSWMSSVVSYPRRPNQNTESHNDSFEGAIPSATGDRSNQSSPAKRSASSPAKSHQIVRIAPKVFTPFMKVEKPKIHRPLAGESKSFSGVNKPMIRNTQLRPLPASRPPRPMEILNQMPGLDSMSSNSFSSTSGRTVYRGSRNMFSDLDTKLPVAEASPRPFSEIPLRTTSLTTYDQTYQSMAHDEPPQHMQRPVSETMPVKRVDKIGMGQIMATDSTKERNKYARDIVNSFQKQKSQPQNAFDEIKEDENFETSKVNNKDTKDTKHKRHTVFNNNLLKGGYTYDKHSRTNSREAANKPSSKDNQNFDSIAPPSNLTQASLSQMHLSVSDSVSSASVGYKTDVLSHNKVPVYKTDVFSHNQEPGHGMTAESAVPIGGGKLVQSHTHGYNGNGNEDMNLTVDKFKRLRSRRDQEIEWLMQDAAETEV